MRPASKRLEPGYLAFSLMSVVTAAALLRAMGHPLVCTCGHVDLWHGAAHSNENSQHLSDWWSLTHVVHGLAFYAVIAALFPRQPAGARFSLAVLVESVWEVFENTDFVIDRYRIDTAMLNYYGDSVVNSASDIGCMCLGFLFAWRAPVWASLALVLGLELAPALAVRDNLMLNIIMLLHPFEAIKAWQMGAG